ncbi:hypothetical protein ACET3X_002055 [Alternaria dauci]|uniref:Glutathione S-transferase n=1 Tax=Alternaria dauci TaxID=48095 RepID=A0ABR3UZ47_9PLEO
MSRHPHPPDHHAAGKLLGRGVHLITASTPNGLKVQIYLEELKILYGTEYTQTTLDIRTNSQKNPWFLKLNPAGQLPILIDNTQTPPFPVIESAADLLFLFKEHDKIPAFGFTDDFGRSECLQWLFFWHGTGQPVQGQLTWFAENAKDNTFALTHFKTELLRIYAALEFHFSGKYTGRVKEYLAGRAAGKYSVADMAAWPWVSEWRASGEVSEEDMRAFPHLLEWIERIGQRPAVRQAVGLQS